MRGNVFGKMLSFISFGESHGPCMGVVMDGIPAGIEFSRKDLEDELSRRAPGKINGSTSRIESDKPQILSGVLGNRTLGTPLAVLINNQNQRSADYKEFLNHFRPGHADKTMLLKFGIHDHRGGGHLSGRETVARVVAGYFASLIIPSIKVKAFTCKLGPFEYEGGPSSEKMDEDFGPYCFPQKESWHKIEEYLQDLKKNGQSVGGKVGVIIDNCPQGLGEPVFNKMKAELAFALLSIGACVSFTYGMGEDFINHYGTEVIEDIDNFGGMEAGITNGRRIYLEVNFRAPSTVGNFAKSGRHDPCVIPRAIPVIEAMVKLVLADHYLRQRAYGENGRDGGEK